MFSAHFSNGDGEPHDPERVTAHARTAGGTREYAVRRAVRGLYTSDFVVDEEGELLVTFSGSAGEFARAYYHVGEPAVATVTDQASDGQLRRDMLSRLRDAGVDGAGRSDNFLLAADAEISRHRGESQRLAADIKSRDRWRK